MRRSHPYGNSASTSKAEEERSPVASMWAGPRGRLIKGVSRSWHALASPRGRALVSSSLQILFLSNQIIYKTTTVSVNYGLVNSSVSLDYWRLGWVELVSPHGFSVHRPRSVIQYLLICFVHSLYHQLWWGLVGPTQDPPRGAHSYKLKQLHVP